MPDEPRPTLRRRRLGVELRRIREEMGLTSHEAARLLNRTQSSLSKLETGHRGIRIAALEHILDKYGVTDAKRRDRLFRLVRETREYGWWESYSEDLSPDMMEFISLEAESTFIGYFELILVPGPLQTEAYARALLEQGEYAGDGEMIDRLVDLRMRRQKVLERTPPPGLHVILDEAALHRVIGGRAVHQAQLRFLREAAELPQVTLQVLPFATGAYRGLSGPFCLMDIGVHDDLRVVTRSSLIGISYCEDEDDLRRYSDMFERLTDSALPLVSSRAVIERLISQA